MQREIILSLFYAERGLVSDIMQRHRVESPETVAAREAMDAMINQSPISCDAFDLVAEYGELMAQDGFVEGFRLAVRLLTGGAEAEDPARSASLLQRAERPGA